MNRTPANARSTAKGRPGPMATAAAYITLCAAIGVQMPFFPLFLTARGLGPEAVEQFILNQFDRASLGHA